MSTTSRISLRSVLHLAGAGLAAAAVGSLFGCADAPSAPADIARAVRAAGAAYVAWDDSRDSPSDSALRGVLERRPGEFPAVYADGPNRLFRVAGPAASPVTARTAGCRTRT